MNWLNGSTSFGVETPPGDPRNTVLNGVPSSVAMERRFNVAFAKLLWPLVIIIIRVSLEIIAVDVECEDHLDRITRAQLCRLGHSRKRSRDKGSTDETAKAEASNNVKVNVNRKFVAHNR